MEPYARIKNAIVKAFTLENYGGGRIWMDEYNCICNTEISGTITTRTYGDNQTHLLEIYEINDRHIEREQNGTRQGREEKNGVELL